MPNWCINTTFVYGKTEDVKAFINPVLKAEMDNEDYNGFIRVHIPCPDELLNYSGTLNNFNNPIPSTWADFVSNGTWTQEFYEEQCARAIADAQIAKSNFEKYGYTGWYEWCIDNWGTKWGDCNTLIEEMFGEETSEVKLDYDTAWSPMESGLVKLSEMFPRLVFTTYYKEEGMGFQGVHRVANGEVETDLCGDIIPTASDYDWMMDSLDETWLHSVLNGTERVEF